MKNTYYVAVCAALVLLLNQSKAQNNTVTYTADNTTNFPNPERGFATPYNQPLCNCSDVAAFEVTEAAWTPQVNESTATSDRINKGISVLMIRYNIAAFRNSNISQKFLDRLTEDFARARRAGIKLHIRFAYGYAGERPDATKDRIISHLKQLKPILSQNNDVLNSMDAGFVGYWGEWHDSSSGNLDGNVGAKWEAGPTARTILDEMFLAVPKNRMITFRYPGHKSQYFHSEFYYPGGKSAWEDWTPMPSSAQAHDGSNMSRAGNHNDSFHGDIYDGTYGYAQNTQFTNIKNRVSTENLYVIQSGEIDAGLNNSKTLGTSTRMIEEGKKMHWSILNAYDSYHNDQGGVIQQWKNDGKYDVIARSLGYRYRMIESTVPTTIRIAEELKMSIKITNDGWASCYNPRQVEIILRNKQSGQKIVISDNAKPSSKEEDPRFWLPGETHILTIDQYTISAGTVTGEYEVLLNLPDPMASIHDRPEYAIRMANQNTWEATTGYNKLLQTITIKSAVSTGITATENGESISVYPNPASEEVTIKYASSNAEKTEIIISDMLSRIVKKQAVQLQTGTNDIKVDVSDLEKGIYTLQLISSNKERITRKLLID